MAQQVETGRIVTESIFLAPLLQNVKRRGPADVAVAMLSVGDLPFDAGIYQNPEEIAGSAR